MSKLKKSKELELLDRVFFINNNRVEWGLVTGITTQSSIVVDEDSPPVPISEKLSTAVRNTKLQILIDVSFRTHMDVKFTSRLACEVFSSINDLTLKLRTEYENLTHSE